MAFLLDIALANLLVAALLASLAALAGLWGRRPAVTHALWLLVLLKLITPPLFDCPIPWPTPPVETPLERVAQVKPMPEPQVAPIKVEEAEDRNPPVDVPMPVDALPELVGEEADVPVILPPVAPNAAAVEAPPVLPGQADVKAPAAIAASDWSWANAVVLAWLAGSCVWIGIAGCRLWRFHRLLRFAKPAPAFAQELARELADCLRVRCPEVCVIPGNVSPMLWALGRSPRLLLPAGLLERLSVDQLRTLLAHELAHWRRRDDRVRWIEVAVLALYWWCPLVWWARRELHQAEEECCDAWVVSILPDSAKEYALALVETVDFLSGAPAMPVLASGLGRVRLLKRRLKMILQGKTPRALTLTGLLVVAAVGLLLLPMVFTWSRSTQVAAQPAPGAEAGQPDRVKKGQPDPREEIQRMQQAIQQRQQELQKGMEELQQMMKRLQQIEAAMKAGQVGPMGVGPMVPGGPGGPNKKGPPGGILGGAPGGPPPGQGGFQGGPPMPGAGGPPPMPGGFPPGGFPGQPPFGPMGGGFQGGGTGPNIEKRLNQVEQKLDTLLQELRGLRQEMNKGPKGPANPGVRPPGGPMPPNVPPPPGVNPPRFTPQPPPVPPAPPGAPRLPGEPAQPNE